MGASRHEACGCPIFAAYGANGTLVRFPGTSWASRQYLPTRHGQLLIVPYGTPWSFSLSSASSSFLSPCSSTSTSLEPVGRRSARAGGVVRPQRSILLCFSWAVIKLMLYRICGSSCTRARTQAWGLVYLQRSCSAIGSTRSASIRATSPRAFSSQGNGCIDQNNIGEAFAYCL